MAATALHLGFQLTVTLVVYPALASVDRRRWVEAHDAHGKAITPIVVLTYGTVLAACLWSIVATPTVTGLWVAVGGSAIAMAATAFVAAPAHGKMSTEPEPALLRQLLLADRVRLFGAVLAVLGAATVAL